MGNKQDSPDNDESISTTTSAMTSNLSSGHSIKYKINHKTKRTGTKRNSKPIHKSMQLRITTNPTTKTKSTSITVNKLNNGAKNHCYSKEIINNHLHHNKENKPQIGHIAPNKANLLSPSDSNTPCSPLSKSRKFAAIYPHCKYHPPSISPNTANTANTTNTTNRRYTINGMITPSPSTSKTCSPQNHNMIYMNIHANNLPIPQALSPYSPVPKKSFSSLHLPIISIPPNHAKLHLSPSASSWSSMSNPYSKSAKPAPKSMTATSTTPWMLYTDIKTKPCSEIYPNDLTNSHPFNHHEVMLSEPSPSPSESLCSYDYRQTIQQFNEKKKEQHSQHSNIPTLNRKKSHSETVKMSLAQSSTTMSIFDETECGIVEID